MHQYKELKMRYRKAQNDVYWYLLAYSGTPHLYIRVQWSLQNCVST